ncbi:hypothetical protein V6N11_083650 [Hibiscus sabdariffa]|uniref:Uncharacterized protein n=1 Tax=Hibiscus sabdariffa TaxID=183260 RepID=A0ABR2QCA4_9ROSI
MREEGYLMTFTYSSVQSNGKMFAALIESKQVECGEDEQNTVFMVVSSLAYRLQIEVVLNADPDSTALHGFGLALAVGTTSLESPTSSMLLNDNETLQATVVGKAPVSDVDVVKSDTLEVSDLCETVQQVFVAEKIPKNCEGVVLPATLVGADSSTDSDTVVEDVDSSTVDVSLGKAVRPFVAYVAVDDCNFPPLAGGRKVRGKKQNSKSEGVEIPGRQPRAAATGVANLLQEMKGRKRDDPDKVKDSSLSVGNVPFVSSQ